jgi:hypothetical protein
VGAQEARVRPVGDLPPDRPSPKRGARPMYLPLLSEIKTRVLNGEGVGEWWELKTFPRNKRGADNALRRIDAKEVEIPPGKWEFETRKTEAGSVLYAKFIPRKNAKIGGDE